MGSDEEEYTSEEEEEEEEEEKKKTEAQKEWDEPEKEKKDDEGGEEGEGDDDEEDRVKPAPQGKATISPFGEIKKDDDDTEGKSDAAIEFMKQMEKKRAEIDEQLKDYIVEWRVQRQKEENDLVKLKEKQVKRKAIRVEQEKKLEAQKKAEEKKRQKDVEDKKRKDQEEKMRRLEETERKRQALIKAETAQRMSGRNFKISKKEGHPSRTRKEIRGTEKSRRKEKTERVQRQKEEDDLIKL